MALDVMGVNYFFYEQAKWDQDERYKNMPTIGTETSSCLSTRGVYFQGDTIRKDFQITSYDVDAPGWGCNPDTQFATNYRYPHLLGEYVWTGFDYLGEPTPFNSDNTNLLNFRTDPSKRAEPDSRKTVIICISRIGVRISRWHIFCRIGTGPVVRGKSFRYMFIPLERKPNCLSTAEVMDVKRKKKARISDWYGIVSYISREM